MTWKISPQVAVSMSETFVSGVSVPINKRLTHNKLQSSDLSDPTSEDPTCDQQ